MAVSSPLRIEYDDAKHKYTVDGHPVPSVTQVLEATEPTPALTWWGMRVGMAAVVELLQLGVLTWPVLQALEAPVAIYDRRHPKHPEVKKALEAYVVANKLSTNHIRDDAADRGTAIHNAAEQLAAGKVIKATDYPPDHRGYLSALWGWWLDQEPEFEEQELIVASRRYMYAGRFDAIVRQDGRRRLTDFKTSSAIYPKHHLQVASYELAHEECGGEPVDEGQIVLLRHDGTYEVQLGKATPEMFLARLEAYRQDRALELRLKPPRKPSKSRTKETA